ncbi:MAG: hypothetical protein AAGJ35_01410 [Myxococcota bacterium]
MSTFLEQVNFLRFRMQRWRKTPMYRESQRKVQMFDRLSRQASFWKEAEQAQRIGQNIDQVLTLFASCERYNQRLCSLEKLAFESLYEQCLDEFEALQSEKQAAQDLAHELELSLYATTFDHPQQATLFFEGGTKEPKLMRMILEIYLQLAQKYDWQYTCFLATRISDRNLHQLELPEHLHQWLAKQNQKYKERAKAEQQSAASQNKKKQEKYEPTPQKPKKPQKQWQQELEALRWPWTPLKLPNLHPVEQLSSMILNKMRTDQPAVLAVAFKGRVVPCFLAHQSGLHRQISGAFNSANQVMFNNRAYIPANLPTVDTLHFPSHEQRVIQENKSIVIARPLGLHVHRTRALSQAYEKLLQANILHRVFGTSAMAWWKATMPQQLEGTSP